MRSNAARSSTAERSSPKAAPLLIIAGAGSGKTNTLAHRVAHLIVSGADPRRILLMTFSRRAAARDEPARRAHRGRRSARTPASLSAALAWAGTFHAIGARLLREYAEQHRPRARLHHSRPRRLRRPDESGSPRPRLLANRKPLPDERHLHLDLFARRQRRDAARRGAWQHFPWCADWEAELRALFAAYVEAKQRQHVLDYDDLLLYWAQMMAEPALAADICGPFRPCPGRRISGHQPPAGLDPAGAQAQRQRPDGRRRRRTVDLLVPRRDRAQYSRLSGPVQPARRSHHART